ncbi:MBL fold metallo-hydrolase [Marinicella meishanensis]|uniref:MBL fold metallo-hydrolase n=1 Tax=Marinicella meishanensis TaxID=2873263 RepID=UPI001CBADB9D
MIQVASFFDPNTNTFSYVVTDPQTRHCAVIDPVLDFDVASGQVSTESADQLVAYIRDQALHTEWLLETHIHADHLTATHYLQSQLGGQTAIGSGFTAVPPHWVPLFDTGADTPIDGSQFDHLLADGTTIKVGEQTLQVMHTPGHTPACSSYLIGDCVFVGDTLFHPQLGTARVDFPGGSASDLYQSIQRLYQLPDDTRVYLCHDYPETRDPTCCVTIGQQKLHNVMVNAQTPFDEFKAKREARDQQLTVPELILPAIQCNMRLGSLGTPHDNGVQYVRIPINQVSKI